MSSSAERSRSFGPVVLLGLGSAALAAVASAKPWFEAAVDARAMPGVPEAGTRIDSPVALAVSLVVLAGWGALLVTRGRARRVVAGVALLGGLGLLAALASAPFTLPDQLREQLDLADAAVSPTGWFVAAGIAAVVVLPALVAAWRFAPGWPEMGSRYDAPGAEPGGGDVDTDDPRALWKALDEGHDPTRHDLP